MNALKATPGPWRVCPPTTEANLWAIEHGSPERVGDICYITLNPNEIEANATLIAAAPDLYEALAEMHRACLGEPVAGGDGCGTRAAGYPGMATLNKANAALAKALGQ